MSVRTWTERSENPHFGGENHCSVQVCKPSWEQSMQKRRSPDGKRLGAVVLRLEQTFNGLTKLDVRRHGLNA